MASLIDTLVITADPGLLVADFNFQLYCNGVERNDDVGDLTVTESVIDAIASAYTVEGRPTVSVGEQWSLTWDTGTHSGVHRYPTGIDTPIHIVLPLRTAGVALADIGAKLLLDGELELTLGDISMASIGDLNDYSLTGLPTPPVGSVYTLAYSWLGVYHSISWPTLVSGVNVGVPAYRSIISDLSEFMYHTLIATPVTRNEYGDETAAGTPLNIRCYIEGGRKLIQDFKGAQVVSRFSAVLFGVYGVQDHDYIYTLPALFGPSTPRRALNVEVYSDENGPHHEVVYF